MLDNGEFDCNFTSDFTPFMPSTSEFYQTPLSYTTSPRYNVDDFSSTSTVEMETEIDTERTDNNSMDIETSEVTTMLSSTVELTTNPQLFSETNYDLTSTTPASTTYSTTDYTSDVSPMLGSGSTKTAELLTTSTVASSTSATTTDFIFTPTTDYNSIVTDTTLSNSFFTDYPMVKTSTESTDDSPRSAITFDTTTEFVTPTTIVIDRNITTIEPKTPACLNKMCQNGGTCVQTPEGAKVRGFFLKILKIQIRKLLWILVHVPFQF